MSCGPYLGFNSKISDCVHIELPQIIDGKKYIYDTVVARAGKCALIIEVLHTHKTEEQKIQAIKNNGMHVAEVKADTILNMLGELQAAKQNGTRVKIPNLLMTDIKCDECKKTEELKQSQAKFDRESYYDSCFVWTSKVWQDTNELYSQYSIAYLHWTQHLDSLWRDEMLKKRKKLRKRGFQMAFQKQELVEDKKRRRYKYENGYKKCFECKQWFPESILYELPRDLWTDSQYKYIHTWYYERDLSPPDFAWGCEECTIDCENCGDRFPLCLATQYGLCFPCNYRRCVAHYNSGK